MRMLKNDKGFTLIEMMIVLVVISILLLALIPNMTKNQSIASDKGCEATVELVQAQVMAYKIDDGNYPQDLKVLNTEGYSDEIVCQGNAVIEYDPTTGEVSLESND
ncbi:competence type IV pilus major pilin ComGC [Salisediminibacterium beveridgei]|uniref:ComG operon protein 3 n=1 Tax=Salisediminibacterium beveridgei TaxID=632773 RepID=A0A1D7QUL4_9BACI|nr:competence type IV pilus major pilin ComGC [Salisediminibacterium beveridgei]AOM82648.1 Late competence protein ComGC [Salisediminibacterium beveridgei]